MSQAGQLEEKVGHPSPARGKVAPWRLFGVLSIPPVLFSLQIIASFGIASNACVRDRLPQTALIIFNVVCIIILTATFLVALADARTVSGEATRDVKELHDEGRGRVSFMVQFGLLMSAMFAIASVVELLAILILGTCTGFAPSY